MANDESAGQTFKNQVISRIPAPSPDLDLPVLTERIDRLLSLVDQTNGFVTEADDQSQTTYVSPGCVDVLGFTPEEVLAGDCIEIHPDDREVLVKGATALSTHGRAFRCVIRTKHKRGEWRWLEINSQASYKNANGGYQSMSVTRDITELVYAQHQLIESEERYRMVSEMSRDLITETTTDGLTRFISSDHSATLGYTQQELLAMPPYALIHEDDVDRIREISERSVETGEIARFEPYRVRTKDGNYLWFESKGHVYQRSDGEQRLLSVTHDITDELREHAEHRDLEAQMVNTQKLESLGVLAGGIAHDFNNLLTPIMGEASLVLDEVPLDSPLRKRLLKIRQAAERAAALTNQMLSYAGKGPLQLEQIDLSQLVEEMGRLVESAVSGKTVLEFDLATELPPMEADSAQISQVVINLISNASEALSDGEGKINVRTGVVNLSKAPAKAIFSENLNPGRHVYLEVTDTGCGMDAETTSKIFDPFFTTKFTGRGLGLAAVAGIVRGHRGAVEINSEPDVGTSFRVLFPASQGAAVTTTSSSPRATTWRASDMVLVVDDDQGVRELAVDILTRVGLEVVTAADGREGVEIFARNADEIKLVLLDRTMPTMGGFQAFQKIRKIRPDAQVVLVSGYSEKRAAAELEGLGLAGFLQKPFMPDALVDVVRKVIEGPAAYKW
ncbi:MAG: PAS domain S-box protein [Myxococcales bacterium]|nr:PAS domain S-box protein [Myxococcales bacterium]